MNKCIVVDIGRRKNRKIVSTKSIKNIQSRAVLFRDIKTKKIDDYYVHLKEDLGAEEFITRDGLKIIKKNPELINFLKYHIFNKLDWQEILETENSKFIITDFTYPHKKVGVGHDKAYDLTYFDKINNLKHRFFIKRGSLTFLKDREDRAHAQFRGIKILEAAGFNILKPYFGIVDFQQGISVIAFEYTNLLTLSRAIDNLITKSEYSKIRAVLNKVDRRTYNKYRIQDIYNDDNIFVERIKDNKIKCYITDIMYEGDIDVYN